MMAPKRLLGGVALLSGLLLSSCNLSFHDLFHASSSSYSKGENPGTVANRITVKEFGDLSGTNPTPSTGKVKILVLPIEIKGYELDSSEKESILSDLEVLFNGSASSTGWESVHSFYESSSYGKLDFEATVAPWFSSGKTISDIERMCSLPGQTAEGCAYVMRDAVEQYRRSSGDDLSSFDSDEDGYLDAVWMVYSAPIDTSETASSLQWAFTYWDLESLPSDEPVGCTFGWASYEFMYEGYGREKVDAHTFVHETGHFLGLSDYYDTTYETAPVGGMDMMDANIIDHCAYSKFLLGWVEPYLVQNEETVVVSPLVSSGECIIVPTSDGFNGSAFDEYLMIEFYVPEGLNRQDSISPYPGNDVQGPNRPAVRVYHVDSRLILATITSSDGSGYMNYIDALPKSLEANQIVARCNSNDQNGSLDPNVPDQREITLLTPERLSISMADNYFAASYDLLFHQGDKLDMERAYSQFPRKNTSNDGSGFDFSLKVENIALDGSSAAISFARS